MQRNTLGESHLGSVPGPFLSPDLSSPCLSGSRLALHHLTSFQRLTTPPRLALPHLTWAHLASAYLALPCLTLFHPTSPFITSPRLTSPRFTLPYLASPSMASPCLTLPCLVWHCLGLPYLTPPGLDLPELTLPCPTLPDIAPPYLASPCLTSSCLVLPHPPTPLHMQFPLLLPWLLSSQSAASPGQRPEGKSKCPRFVLAQMQLRLFSLLELFAHRAVGVALVLVCAEMAEIAEPLGHHIFTHWFLSLGPPGA